ncbi:MAG: prolyl oligopeptidase family serine peptidase [Gammaproteobacteria bacterium]
MKRAIRFVEMVACPLFLLALAAPAAAAAQYRTETLTLTLDNGRELAAQLRIPGDAKGRLPALMLFGGFRGAARVLDKVQAPPRPVVLASFDYPFEPPRRFSFPRSLAHAPEARAAIHASFDGIGKLYEALARHPRVDPARITVAGASAGMPFATVGAARNPIPGVLMVQGTGDVTAVIANLIARKYRPKYGDWVRTPSRWIAEWINWYCEIPDIAGEARKLRAGQKALMITATQDDFVPPAAAELLWQALRESDAQVERVDVEGIHLGLGDDSAQIAEIFDRSMRWMERQGLL